MAPGWPPPAHTETPAISDRQLEQVESEAVVSIGDFVDLEPCDKIGPDLIPLLEPLIGLASQVIDSECLEFDDVERRNLERDRDYLHAEMYENPDAMDAAIVNAVTHRILRFLSPAILDGRDGEILDRLLDAPGEPPEASNAIEAADNLALVVEASSAYGPGELGVYEWTAIQLGWYRFASRVSVKGLREIRVGDAVEFISLSSGVTTLLLALGMSGLLASLAGAYIGLLAATWRGKRVSDGN